MKLKELLLDLEKENLLEDSTLKLEKLRLLKEKLLQCEEFSEVTDIEFCDYPNLETKEGMPLKTEVYKLKSDWKPKGKIVLYTIGFTPTMYKIEDVLTPVKDNAAITPTIFNEETFKPYKTISLLFSPEETQDSIINMGETKKQLHSLLDKVLDNPLDYQIKGDRDVLIRGLFDLEGFDNIETSEENFKHFTVFTMDYIPNEKGDLCAKTMAISVPKELKEEFVNQFTGKPLSLITSEKINEFLNKHKK